MIRTLLSCNLPKSTRNWKLSMAINMSTYVRNLDSIDRIKKELKDIFEIGIDAVLPHNLVEKRLKLENNKLFVGEQSFHINENVYLVGFGKAVMKMVPPIEKVLGSRLVKGIISIPVGSKESIWKCQDFKHFPRLSGPVEYKEGAENNQPDVQSLSTTDEIIDLVEGLTKNDTLIVLISGGGSALLCMPRPTLDLNEKQRFCKKLQNAGADISELNTVRKKLSMVKGGGLARFAYPATVISLIISDIVGDPVDLIASGPTVYSPRSPDEVTHILKKYDLLDTLEWNIKTLVTSKDMADDRALLNSKKEFTHVSNVIIGSNLVAIQAAKGEAIRKGYSPIILRNDIQGNVSDVSLSYVKLIRLICMALEQSLSRATFFETMQTDPIISLSAEKIDEICNVIDNTCGRGIVLIGGGEPTVVVTGNGKGGRNQQLALQFALDWFANIKDNPRLSDYEVVMLSGGTDGQDGPTDAAGAFGYSSIGPIVYDLKNKLEILLKEAQNEKVKSRKLEQTSEEIHDNKSANMELQESQGVNIDNVGSLILKMTEVEKLIPENVIKNNDAYNFFSRFRKGKDLFKIGLTGTNVMDLHIVCITKRQCGCQIDFQKDSKYLDSFDEHDLSANLSKQQTDNNEGLNDVIKNDDYMNLKIVDNNLAKPCCSKKRRE